MQLWGVALRSLKGVLEAAFEQQLSTAAEMLQVKGFVVLMCVALERAGHQVSHVLAVLQAAALHHTVWPLPSRWKHRLSVVLRVYLFVLSTKFSDSACCVRVWCLCFSTPSMACSPAGTWRCQ
jgi:hypothetical protein